MVGLQYCVSHSFFKQHIEPSCVSLSHREYALVGCVDGTSFVDVTDPMSPAVLGFLPTHSSSSLWRDIKVGSVCVCGCVWVKLW